MLRLPGNMCPGDWAQARQQARDQGVEPILDFFMGYLGEDWQGWSEGRPLAGAFFTKMQGVALGPRAFEVFQGLASTSSKEAIHAAVMRLASKEWAHFEGTELEVAMAGACLHGKVAVTLRDSKQQGADLEVVLDADPILVECKALQPRNLDDEVSDLMADLVEATSPLRGKSLHVVLNGEPEDFVVAAPLALDFIEGLEAVEDFEERQIGPITLVPGSPPWGSHYPITGPGIAVYSRAENGGDLLDLVKLRKIVRSASKQLDSGKGVFVVGVRNAFYDGVLPAELAEHLKDTISLLNNVSAVMVVQRDFVAGGKPRLVNAPGFWAYWGANTRGLQSGGVLVENPNAEHPLFRTEAERLIRLVPLL